MVREKLIFPLFLALLGVVIISCQGLGGQTSKPTVIIGSPPSGSVYVLGEQVAVQSTATDPLGVTGVTLLVDGTPVHDDPTPVTQGQAQFSVIQTWLADTAGQHTLTVRATNTRGVSAEAGILINVRDSAGQVPTIVAIATPAPFATITPPAPTSQSAGSVTSVATAPPACTNNSKFVADLTIPDGTNFTPNALFTKSWRVQNTGTCPWENYSLVFVTGTQMASGASFPVPNTAPGAGADLTVPMTAPQAYGSYSGTWRLRNSAGQNFGTNLTVVINVPAPATAVPPTNTPVPTVAGCSGKPNDFTFAASAPAIVAGQSVTLSWSAVTNASEVRLDGGEFSNDGVETPGNRTVSPAATQQYTLTAKCNNGGQTRQKSVTVTVNAAAGTFAGEWLHNFGTMSLTQNGASVAGTYTNEFSNIVGTVEGTVTGNKLVGEWHAGGNGTIEFTLSNDGKRFSGNWNGTQKWCGARAGEQFPDGCSFQGAWTSDYGEGDCGMTLVRQDNQVTGSYCIGTITGTYGYENGQAVVTGTYSNIASVTGPLKFFLFGYNGLQFNGNYNGTNEWCGWRESSSKPAICKKP